MSFFNLASHMLGEVASRPSFRGKSTGLYPSEASFKTTDKYGRPAVEGACLRNVVLKHLGMPGDSNTISGGKQLMFRVGIECEQAMIDEYKKSGMYVDSNVKFFWKRDTYAISGEVDAFILNPETKETEIVELKSYYGYAAEKEVQGSKRPLVHGKPKPQQLSQLMIYLDFYKAVGVNVGHMHYIERGSGKSKSFQVKLDDQGYALVSSEDYTELKTDHSVHDIYSRYQQTQYFIDNKIVPVKDFTLQFSQQVIDDMYTAGDLSKTDTAAYERGKEIKKGNWNCRYCSYMEVCQQMTEQQFTSCISQRLGADITLQAEDDDLDLEIN